MPVRSAATVLLFAAALLLFVPVTALAGRDAERKLDGAIARADAEAAAAAIRELGSEGGAAAARAIVAGAVKAAAAGIDLEEAALEALAGMTAEDARRWLVKAAGAERHWMARFLVVAALARVGTPEAEDAVVAALEDKEPRVGAAAVEHLKKRASAATVGKLVDALGRLDRERRLEPVRAEVASALRDLTGMDLEETRDWKNWWDQNGASFQLRRERPPDRRGGRGRGDDVVSRLRENRPSDYRTVERLSGEDILVFKGRSDRVERVLDALGLPYTLADRAKLAETQLDPKQVLIFNCNGKGDPLSDADLERLRGAVERGAYLFTSDWEATQLLERAFPGKISVVGHTPWGAELLVRIRPVAAAAAHPYNRDVLPLDPFRQASFSWKVHEATHLVKCGEGAIALIESEELSEKLAEAKDRRGRKAPIGKDPLPVAVTFRSGAGSVLHVLSHFQDQRTREGDGFALQQLLLNFIVEKQRVKARFGS